MQLVMDATALNAFLSRDFAQVAEDHTVETADDAGVTCRLRVGVRHLRPGGTVSGPAMFGLADLAIYLALLSRIGEVPLAVTVNASIDFLRKPAAGRDLLADARLLKVGRTLAVAAALIVSEGGELPVARASMTYAIPPESRPRGTLG